MTQWPGREVSQQWPGRPVEAETPAAAAPGRQQPEEDQYRRAAREDLAAAEKSGAPSTGAYQRRLMHGATLGASETLLAGALTPFEMIRRGTWNPAEGYNYAKAREDLELERAREQTGLLGTVAELGGGVASGVGLAKAGASGIGLVQSGLQRVGGSLPSFLTNAQAATQAGTAGLGARTLASAADAGALGAVTGFNEGSGTGRLSGALHGGALGLGLGAAAPVAGAAISTAAAPIVSNISARINPERFAANQAARAISDSGRPVQQVVDDVAQAAREGQGVYTVADALGNPGQRMLSTVTRNPGQGRTQAVEFLDARQAEQGRRLAGAMDDAFGGAQTAQQLKTAEEAARTAEANIGYGAARQQAGPVDVSAAIAKADQTLSPGINRVVSTGSQIADNTIEAAVHRARSLLTDGKSNLSDFSQVLLAKQNLDDMIARAAPNQQRVLIGVRNELDRALEAASAPYASARNAFRDASQGIEAIQTGRQAAQRGRYEDTIPQFQALKPHQQEGFRVGYADPQIEAMQGAAQGVNRARPLTSDASQAERAAFARPGEASLLSRRIDRENRMFDTRQHATGGSRTADNLADNAATGISPEIVANFISGNWAGAARNLMSRSGAALNGNTAAVREQLANILLARGANAQQVGTLLDKAASSQEHRRRLAALLLRGGMGAGVDTPAAIGLNSPATNSR